jgi:cephalosporin hydroxylase
MRRAHSIRGRDFAVSLPAPALAAIQQGVLKMTYKGRRFCKNPFDLVLYLRLLEALRPRTIIEIGTSEGGSALWFRDQASALGFEATVHSFDVKPPADFDEPGIVIGAADAFNLESTLPAEALRAAAHPWLVVEDSAHEFDSTLAVLRYFDRLVQPGDYVVVEDGVVADLPGEAYRRYDDGPNRAVAAFLVEAGDRYEIDTGLCDYFGHNVTYCPNAWLRVAGG